MKTLADFKRTLKPGQAWHTYHHIMNRDMGVRTVKAVLTTAVTFNTPEGRESWLYYPKAKDMKFPGENRVEVYDEGQLCLTYKLVEDTYAGSVS